MNILSIFVDESGDFGPYRAHSPYYIISLVLHEQKNCIKTQVSALENTLNIMGLGRHIIHTAPLIRREQQYKNIERRQRIKIFDTLYHFIRKIDIRFKLLTAKKDNFSSSLEVTAQISAQMSRFLKENLEYFVSFDKIIVYYDNGQLELTKVLVSVFTVVLGGGVEFRKVFPANYRLFQTADFICAMGLLEQKILNGKEMSVSETEFLGSPNKLRKKYLKDIKKKEII